MELSDIDLTKAETFVEAVPHEWFAYLRQNAPVWWHEEDEGPGFWCVTKYDDCVTVNRDYDTFSSARKATFIWDMPEEAVEQQRLMMLNMDPPLHTRYRRLVNKGFTPRTISQLEQKIVWRANQIIDQVCESGSCDLVAEISSELPLQVIAELLGVPEEDRHLVFDWSNRMIGRDDPEYQLTDEMAT